ncbi:MAG: nitrite/sulfite reductase, partial [Vogesella sp.]|uniref:nitrite/sulfite reductase n=1 Tax=Vogesella sp. TaxID=1904252 RepID=UPI003F35CA37
NIQFNWPELARVPDILAELADVEMHAIQTSGNCVRNTTTDAFAGVAADELIDGRAYCEIIRQWSTLHPEFAYLPRKFKIAVSGSADDRAATQVHDIGLHVVRNEAGEVGFRVLVGGGLGRTPIVGKVVREFLPPQHLLTYLDAVLRVYNRYGRRDNKYKARIKILVQAMTVEAFAAKVEDEWLNLKDGPSTLTEADVAYYAGFFTDPAYESLAANPAAFTEKLAEPAFARWVERNTRAHKRAGYRSVVLSLKKTGVPPGDISADQMDAVADMADRFGFGEIRSAHEQNLILPDVKESDLYEVWQLARQHGFATPNIGLLTDIICCPGGDFCDLANARSIPVAEAIQRKFDDLDYLFDLGDIDCNFSGCMNACGHHHIGNIGILGVDKNGQEWYQITLGGSQGNYTAIGKVIGPSFAQADVPAAFEKIMTLYVEQRQEGERFIETVRRIGLDPFKERVYAKSH